MHRKVQRNLARDGRESFDDLDQLCGIIDIRWPVQSYQAVGFRRGSQARQNVGLPGFLDVHPQRVDHQIAHQVNVVCWNTFGEQIPPSAILGDEQKVGNSIRHHAVDLLGHGPIETSQAGLDVNDGYLQLFGHQGAGHGGVDVADHQYRIGTLLDRHRFEALHDLARLLRVRAYTDLEIEFRRGHRQIAEELAGHLVVVVLPRVYDEGRKIRISFKCSHQRRQLRSEEHTSELQSHVNLVCRLLLEKK